MKTQFLACLCLSLLSLAKLSAQHALIRTPHPLPPELASQMAVDHFLLGPNDSIDWVASRKEQALLQAAQLAYRTLQADMEAFYRQSLQQSQARTSCGLQHYSQGSMGGYHTYTELVGQLNLMHQLFPTLCGTPYSIGQSIEGREIYAIKLSDQVNLNQRQSEARVYLDALTHAREPMSMESLLAFAWWLLENYGTDETATYLLDNREIYLLPVINPDGYVYNEQIAPNGGGLWRKNRAINSNSNCFGVDLNRNYPWAWGDLSGSSDNPCSDTYHGASTNSEPESSAARAMIDSLGATAGFSVHSYGQVMLHPWLWQNNSSDFALASELASDFIPATYEAYGNGPEMLNYLASGTTADYMQSQDMLSWTPEVGRAFWEPASKICERVEEMRKPLLHICWLAGAFARVQHYECGPVIPGDTTGLSIRIKNRGIGDTARNVEIHCRTLSDEMSVLDPAVNLGDIAARNARTWSALPIRLLISPNAQQLLALEVSVRQGLNLMTTQIDTLYLRPGNYDLLWEEDFENGRTDWIQQSGNWNLTAEDVYQGQRCLAESPGGLNHLRNWTTITYDTPITIPNDGFTELSFWHKYSLAPYKIDMRLQIATDNGNWLNLHTPSMVLYSDSTPVWTGHKYWQQERVNLSAYRGQTIKLRWAFNGNATNISSDGYYLDEIQLRQYERALVSLEDELNPTKIDWLALDGRWPIYVTSAEGIREPVQLSYYDLLGQELLSVSLGTLPFGERLSLPELGGHRGPLLIALKQGNQLLAQRWTMIMP
ncbi:MAG: M14 family zinc carboxypeptidase [Bacteroidota bacterium]